MRHLDQRRIEILEATERETEENIIAELTQIFEQMAPEMILNMRKLLRDGKMYELSDIAHTLKSSALGIGASKMGNLCLFIETNGRKIDDDHNFAEIIDQIENEFSLALAELHEINSSKTRQEAS